MFAAPQEMPFINNLPIFRNQLGVGDCNHNAQSKIVNAFLNFKMLCTQPDLNQPFNLCICTTKTQHFS